MKHQHQITTRPMLRILSNLPLRIFIVLIVFNVFAIFIYSTQTNVPVIPRIHFLGSNNDTSKPVSDIETRLNKLEQIIAKILLLQGTSTPTTKGKTNKTLAKENRTNEKNISGQTIEPKKKIGSTISCVLGCRCKL